MRSGTTLATLRPLSNITGFAAGRHFRLDYPSIELLALDAAMGITLVSATLVIATEFGAAPPPLLTKAIGLAPNPLIGQITDRAEDDGVGALYFQLMPDDTVLLSTAAVFEVVVVDSAGRETTLDAGAIVAAPSTVASVTDPDTDVATVQLSPERAAAIVTHGFAVTAAVLDSDGNPLLGRTITWASANEAVATVDDDGLVTPVGTGTTTVTGTVDGVSGDCIVTIERLTLGSGVRIGGITP